MGDKDEELVRLELAIKSSSSPVKVAAPAVQPPPPPPPPPAPPPPPPAQQQPLLLKSKLLSMITHPAAPPSLILQQFFSPTSLPPEPPTCLPPSPPHPSSHLASTSPQNAGDPMPPTSLPPSPPHPSSHLASTSLQNAGDPMPPTCLPPSPPHPSSHLASTSLQNVGGPMRPSRTRKSPTRILRGQGKSDTIPPPYPWATTQRAKVRSISDLLSDGIMTITGDVQCKRCEKHYQIEYDLQEKFTQLDTFISINMDSMHDRAPPIWMSPTLPNCRYCEQTNCVKPILGKKRCINWLFLFLGQMLGCCKLSELKYFCKHTRCHRTGAKDRVLYLTYLGLRKQLDS